MKNSRLYTEDELQKLHEILLMMMKDFAQICEENNLQYWGTYGTFLGAVRHKGFIPWDDDVDIGMPRKDYDRFIDIVNGMGNEKYVVINPEIDENYPLMTTRFMLRGTKFREWSMKDVDCDLGIFFDIAVFDAVPDDEKKRKKQFRMAFLFAKLHTVRSVCFPSLFGIYGIKKKLVHMVCFLLHYAMKILRISKKWLARKCIQYCTMYNDVENTTYFTYLCGATPSYNLMKRIDILPTQKLTFENIKFSFPQNTDKVLRKFYGEYMQLPPVDERVNHCPAELDFGEYGGEINKL